MGQFRPFQCHLSVIADAIAHGLHRDRTRLESTADKQGRQPMDRGPDQ
jgi:hypothetical protein